MGRVAGAGVSWLDRERVLLPDPGIRFVERSGLQARCDPLQRHLTVIQAPAGFGKTMLLAAACRRRREAGDVVAWLTLDERDGGLALANHIGLAFAEAGLRLLESTDETDSGSYLIDILMHSVAAHGADCVLALDDAHVLREAGSAALVRQLLRGAPPNLHFALAMREFPVALDVASFVFEGRGEIVGADDLRFDEQDIAGFFDGRLKRSELRDLVGASRGWPIALSMLRNVRRGGADAPLDPMTANWLDVHFWRSLPAEERDLVFDAAQFDRVYRKTIDELVGRGSFDMLRSLPVLQGLVQSIGDSDDIVVIHPLIRSFCRDRRFRETPERYRAFHARIADLAAEEGHVILAMRHAHEADDPRQVARILEDANGFRLWLRYGPALLRQVDELLTNAVLAACPRLWLIRCLELTIRGELERATTAYVNAGAITDGFTRHGDGREDPNLALDHLVFRFVLSACRCRPVSARETLALVEEVRKTVEALDSDPVLRGAFCDGMCWIEHTRGNMASARHWARRAIADLDGASRYLRTHVEMHIGSIAMAEGRVADAVESYAKARQGANAELLRDTGPAVVADVLTVELNIERFGYTASQHLHRMPMIAASAGVLDIYDAAAEAVIARATSQGGPTRALADLDEIREFADGAGLEALSRSVSAMRVSLLVSVERVVEAQDVWVRSGFPEDPAAIATLANQTWREMEALSCARLRLLTARSRFDPARELAEALLGTTRAKGLRRTEMRALALAMAVEYAAGDRARARGRLVEYLELYRETDYARSLILERNVVLDLLEGIEDMHEGDLADVTVRLAGLLRNGPRADSRDPLAAFTPRELEILGLLEGSRDKEIANAIGLSQDGVRYHLKNIYRKIGASNRFEAVRRARETGIL